MFADPRLVSISGFVASFRDADSKTLRLALQILNKVSRATELENFSSFKSASIKY